MRKDYRYWINSLADEAENAARMGNTRQLYMISKKLCNSHRPSEQPIKDAQGNLLVTEEKQLLRWREHFCNILNRPMVEGYSAEFWNDFSMRPITGGNEDPPSKDEIVRAVKELKNHKAPGMDNIPAELFKVDPDAAAHALHPLLTNVWITEKLPPEWKQGLLIKLPKKGNRTDCNNWRGITLLCTVSKILSKVILYRIQDAIEATIRTEQAGFRKGTSCVDQINSLRIIVEESVEWRKPLFMTFVDFEKAFDSINRQFIWDALEQKGLPLKIIRIIKEAYNGFNCKVVHNGKLTEAFDVTTGVRQGCLLSPLIFIVVMDAIMLKITMNNGIRLPGTETLNDLDFADDICLLSESHINMQTNLTTLQQTAEKAGLKINRKKTEEMRVCNNSDTPTTLEGQVIERVEKFCYLGSFITPQGGADCDVESRINKARGAFAQLKSIWQSTRISRHTKIRLFNSNVKSVLLYACETWRVTSEINRKLQVFVNNCLRSIVNRHWPNTISNVELWKLTEQQPVDIDVRERKWRWLGHTLRRPAGHIPQLVLDWKPANGSRRVGRPTHTWKRSVIKEAEQKNVAWADLKQLAQDRRNWKNLLMAPSST